MSGKVLVEGGLVTREYSALSQPRMLVTNLTQSEVATLEGDRFSAQADFTLTGGGTQYLQITMPSVEDARVNGFIFRDIKSEDGIDFSLFWDPTGVVKGAPITPFNENRLSPNIAATEFTYVTSVTTEGTPREVNFSVPGQGNRGLSGAITPDTGYRLYAPSNVALLKITDLSGSANRVLISYGWIEAPTSL